MTTPHMRALFVASFNIQNLADTLQNDGAMPAINPTVAPFGQVLPTLLDPSVSGVGYDFAVVWTAPEQICAAFKRLLSFARVSSQDMIAEVDAYCQALLRFAPAVKFMAVPEWTLPVYQRGWGILDLRNELGCANMLARMNLRLCEQLAADSRIYVLPAARWLQQAGKHASNPKLWYMGKIAFSAEVFSEAARDIRALCQAIYGAGKKLIILDLDDTLWGGIVGETGLEALQLGGHDPTGEAFADFQQVLRGLRSRGILLAIASKNEETTALQAIDRHPEMVLRRTDFSAWRINWEDKAANIASLLAELNLGAQSAVFIDDSPAERARVQAAFPEMLVPAWPSDKMTYASTLLGMRCFDAAVVTGEDFTRGVMVDAEKKREQLRAIVASAAEWHRQLGIAVTASIVDAAAFPRMAQLFNKTNQFNLATRRLSEAELHTWLEHPCRRLWVFSVSDKFGAYGLTGIVSLEWQGGQGRIVDFILSCRVMGRKVEEAMLHTLCGFARDHAIEELLAEYLPTAKNGPCLEFFKRSGFTADATGHRFSWRLVRAYPVPEGIELHA